MMPKDNHSLMQLYLDGPKNNFFTFFRVEEKVSNKSIKNTNNLPIFIKKYSHDILKAQFEATQNVFKKRKIPFRTFIIKRDENSRRTFFIILETVILGKVLKINPFNQPSR